MMETGKWGWLMPIRYGDGDGDGARHGDSAKCVCMCVYVFVCVCVCLVTDKVSWFCAFPLGNHLIV